MGKLKLKVCGMKYRENIEELIRLAPDYIGFIFYPKSNRYAKDELSSFPEVINLPIEKIGVFVNETIENIVEVCSNYVIKIIQLHGKEEPDFCRQLKEKGYKIIKAFSVDDVFDFNSTIRYERACDYFLFDTKASGDTYGGTGKKFDWKLLKNYKGKVPFFLSGGIDTEDITHIKNLLSMNIHSLDINSRFEISPGLKDVEKIRKFKEEIEAF